MTAAAEARPPMATFLLVGRGDIHLRRKCANMTQSVSKPVHSVGAVSCFGAGGVMTKLRILAIIYVVQAGIGIATGFAYAVWLMYW